MVLHHNYFRITIILIYVLVFFSSGVSAVEKPYAPENIPGATSISAEQVVELILSNPDMIIIDSRKKTEYLKGHIEGAINILNTELALDDLETIAPDRTQALLFYCNGARCLRSSDSINKAIDWGYTTIFWFRGGWQEWTEKRLPVITE
jgi:rhodanese-related sulfurtransferase